MATIGKKCEIACTKATCGFIEPMTPADEARVEAGALLQCRKCGEPVYLRDAPEPDPKPPGVTVRISRWYDSHGRRRCSWTAIFEGCHDALVKSSYRGDTRDDAKVNARKTLTELVSQLLPGLKRDGIELRIKFVEE